LALRAAAQRSGPIILTPIFQSLPQRRARKHCAQACELCGLGGLFCRPPSGEKDRVTQPMIEEFGWGTPASSILWSSILEQAPKQVALPADLKALESELEELCRRIKPRDPTKNEEIRPAVMIVRGK
jgi:hypothetical protein